LVAKERAAVHSEHNRRRLLLEERNQLIELFKLQVYTKEQLIEKLNALDSSSSLSFSSSSSSSLSFSSSSSSNLTQTQRSSLEPDIEHEDTSFNEEEEFTYA
jgi:hypothetical protein